MWSVQLLRVRLSCLCKERATYFSFYEGIADERFLSFWMRCRDRGDFTRLPSTDIDFSRRAVEPSRQKSAEVE